MHKKATARRQAGSDWRRVKALPKGSDRAFKRSHALSRTQVVARPFESARASQRLALGPERRIHARAHFAPRAAGAHDKLARHVDAQTARLRRLSSRFPT